MAAQDIRTALIGAGYIASWHADAIAATKGIRVSAVCDTSPAAAEGLAGMLGVPARTSLDDLFAEDLCDAVHVLTPPQTHRDIAVAAFEAGRHVLVEKPVALAAADVAAMGAAAQAAGKVFAAGHNFLASSGYARLKRAVRQGDLGRVSAAEFNWRFPLPPLRSGPYSLWMLRAPENLLLELGPHLYAFALDLFGAPEEFTLSLGKPVALPGGGTRHQSWRILARAGQVDLAFNLSLVETFDDRSVTVYGSSGIGRLDFAADTLRIARENAADIIVNPLLRQGSMAWQEAREGLRNAAVQAASLNARSPYALSFRGTTAAFVAAIRENRPVDARFSAGTAEAVVRALEDTLALMPPAPAPAPAPARTPQPSVLVIGGTGFIGRYLVRGLVASGRDVRVFSRGRGGPFADLADHVETVSGSLKSAADLEAAMAGCEAVFHLAKAEEKSWAGYLENDVKVTERIAEAALATGVRRFIYTGTIASYDMSEADEVITEETGFGEDLEARNLYARSKATCEALLEDMHRDRGLPLVIARPGIVVGREGPLQHWGIGRWNGAGAVRIWNDGKNLLPFVLVEDVADALIAMIEAEGAVGQSFNLIADPMVSARGYFEAIARLAGARIRVAPGVPRVFFLSGAAKYLLKKHVLRKTGLERTSLRDWKSRGHLARFDNARAKQVLGWQPESDPERFLQRAIVEADLFGF